MWRQEQTYEEWRVGVTSIGGIHTIEAVRKRITVLSNPELHETKRFAELYGSEHLEQVTLWFTRLEKEL